MRQADVDKQFRKLLQIARFEVVKLLIHVAHEFVWAKRLPGNGLRHLHAGRGARGRQRRQEAHAERDREVITDTTKSWMHLSSSNLAKLRLGNKNEVNLLVDVGRPVPVCRTGGKRPSLTGC